MPAGCVAVVDAMGVTDAGIFGDILCERIRVREVAGLITDGVIRDLAGVLRTNLPVWCEGTAAPASVTGLTFVGWQMPIACGGVAVFPDDIIVADDDGAVVIPAALLDEVVEAAVEQEKLEAWIIDEVRSGLPLPGLYPPNAETKARYAAFCAAQSKQQSSPTQIGGKHVVSSPHRAEHTLRSHGRLALPQDRVAHHADPRRSATSSPTSTAST